MFKKIDQQLITLTPELAQEFLEYNIYFVQRPLRPAHVEDLRKKFISGRFRTATRKS